MAPKKGISLHVYVICQVLGGYTPLTILPLSHLRPRYNLQLTWHNCSVLLGNYNGLNKALSNKMNAPRVGGGGLASGGTPRLRGRASERVPPWQSAAAAEAASLNYINSRPVCTPMHIPPTQPNNPTTTHARRQSVSSSCAGILWNSLARPLRTPKNSDCGEFKGRRREQ